MDIKEILSKPDSEAISLLSAKEFNPPAWSKLEKEYDPKKHDVMSKTEYPDFVSDNGSLEKMVRITYAYQKLAVKRMTELCFGTPVNRIYKPQNERQTEVSKWIESILSKNRFDSVNIERGNMLFASCEFLTIWYATLDKNNIYGFDSKLKLRCKNFSPMEGDELYPLFDEFGDMVAMSVKYTSSTGGEDVTYFETYTSDRHLKWSNEEGDFAKIVDERINIGKIPAIYCMRKTPIWEDTTSLVNEMEMAVSRNGNYLKKNTKPILAIAAQETLDYGNEKEGESRAIIQIPQGGSVQYVTWQQATDNLKFYVDELRQQFFTQLQLPDWSYESMKSTPMSGESRKQLFIDAMLKVKDESGRILEALDRELNVIRAFLKVMQPSYAKDIDELQIETEIKPFTINDESERINNLVSATAGKPIISQKTAIETLGWVSDAEAEQERIQSESETSFFAQ